jgi:cytochrome c peroxidase
MTDDAVLGRVLFESLDCRDCHVGEAMTDSALDIRHDVGTIRATSGQRLSMPLDGIDTPTLRGVWNGAPYLHDGSAESLEEVLRIPEHGNAQDLPDGDMDDLVAFLRQLDNDVLDYAEEEEPERPLLELGGGGCSCRTTHGEHASGWLLFCVVGWVVWGRRRS